MQKPKYILSINKTKERLANQVSHMPLKLAAGQLPEGGSLDPVGFYKMRALQDKCQPRQVPSKFNTKDVKGMETATSHKHPKTEAHSLLTEDKAPILPSPAPVLLPSPE